ncbi:MAG: hypothetical protein ACPLYX_02060 [Rectinema subterraneum]|uniref:hypothetical protein n=1 Tax=Rectinema subterraneum TaxID=2653714 RepID=UPI003C7B7034
MRIGISSHGTDKVSRMTEMVRRSFAEMGHEAAIVSDSPYGLSAYDFLVFITEPKSMFGGIASSLPQTLAKSEGLIGKRCLALVRKSGFRSGSTLRKFMEALEHEGLVVVQGEIVSDASSAAAVARGTPLNRR